MDYKEYVKKMSIVFSTIHLLKGFVVFKKKTVMMSCSNYVIEEKKNVFVVLKIILLSIAKQEVFV